MVSPEQNNDEIQKTAISLLQELIRNQCVNDGTADSGNEIKSVKTLTNFFDSYGITSYEIFEPHETRANLLVTIEGYDSKKSLTLESHLDVVPVSSAWSVDPFSGIIKDNWLYGRGAIDMLMYTASGAVTLAALIQSGWKPTGTLKFLAVADEEAGCNYGSRWLVENVPAKIKTDYLFGEIGGATVETPSGLKMGVMNAEKGPAWVKMTIKGVAGHGSIPYQSKNALEIMSLIVANMKQNPPPVNLTPEWKNFVKGLGLSKLNQLLLTNRQTVNFALSQLEKSDVGLAKVFHALTRMTVSPNVGTAGTKVNVIPDEAVLEADFRLLSGQSEQDVRTYLQKVIPHEYQNTVDIQFPFCDAGSSDPWNTPFTDLLCESYNEMYPDQKVAPVFIPGVTDAQYFRKIGIKCYGASVLTNKVSIGLMTELYHGVDERIPIEALSETVKFYSSISKKYLS